MAKPLPHLLGSAILFVGAADIVTDILERNSNPGKIAVGTDMGMIVFGIITLLNTHESLNVIAVVWGLLGLGNAAAKGDESLKARTVGHKLIAPLTSGIFELVLGTIPLLAATASLGHHVLLLGLELVVYPFHVVTHEERAKAGRAE